MNKINTKLTTKIRHTVPVPDKSLTNQSLNNDPSAAELVNIVPVSGHNIYYAADTTSS
jgi:hypothetical protein